MLRVYPAVTLVKQILAALFYAVIGVLGFAGFATLLSYPAGLFFGYFKFNDVVRLIFFYIEWILFVGITIWVVRRGSFRAIGRLPGWLPISIGSFIFVVWLSFLSYS